MSLKRQCTTIKTFFSTIDVCAQPRLRPWMVPHSSNPVCSPQPSTHLLLQVTLTSSPHQSSPTSTALAHKQCSPVWYEVLHIYAFGLAVLSVGHVQSPLLRNSTWRLYRGVPWDDSIFPHLSVLFNYINWFLSHAQKKDYYRIDSKHKSKRGTLKSYGSTT